MHDFFHQQYVSGQITIIPKPRLRAFWGHFPYFSPHYGVTSAEVVIIWPDVHLSKITIIYPDVHYHEILDKCTVSPWMAWIIVQTEIFIPMIPRNRNMLSR